MLRQISQFWPAGLERLLHACDLVDGDAVDDPHGPPPKSRGETLFDISEQRFSVHGSLVIIGATIPVRRKPAMNVSVFPVPHWNIAKDAFSAWAPTVGTDHVGSDGSGPTPLA